MLRLGMVAPGLALALALPTLALASPTAATQSGVPADAARAWVSQTIEASPDGLAPFLNPDAPRSLSARKVRGILRSSSFTQRFSDSREARLVLRDVVRFYTRRGYTPAWLNPDGTFPLAGELLASVKQTARHGLHPEHYPLDDLAAAIHPDSVFSINRLIETEVLLSHLYLTCARHLYHGRIDPSEIEDIDWHVKRESIDLAGHLTRTVSSEQIARSLDRLTPATAEYRELVRTLEFLQKETPWPRVPGGFKAALDDCHPKVAAVRKYLRAVGDLSPGPDPDPQRVDGQMEDAVKRFQKRHGLDEDGVIGPATLAQMNVTVKERLRSVRLNLERHRWFPDGLPDNYLLVNVPRFEMEVHENAKHVFSLRAIAGSKSNPTPSFADEMEFIQLNPFWHVPRTIARDEILQKVQEDSAYIATQDFDVFDQAGARVNPDEVSWAALQADSMSYRFRQSPGSKNPLGTVKFLFPNRFSVYMHDTNNRKLFNKSSRAMSHGCIRLEQPIKLADYLLRDQEGWGEGAVEDAIQKGSRKRIHLPKPLPVYLTYFTVFTEGDGSLGFRHDVYERDDLLQTALDAYRSPYQPEEPEIVATLEDPANQGAAAAAPATPLLPETPTEVQDD